MAAAAATGINATGGGAGEWLAFPTRGRSSAAGHPRQGASRRIRQRGGRRHGPLYHSSATRLQEEDMLIVREVFVAKPGQAGKLAKLWKRVMGSDPNIRILTDLVGNYNSVVMEMQVESLAAWEQEMQKYQRGEMPPMDPADAEAMKNYTEQYLTGRREVWQVV
jgi:hypothetical protein